MKQRSEVSTIFEIKQTDILYRLYKIYYIDILAALKSKAFFSHMYKYSEDSRSINDTYPINKLWKDKLFQLLRFSY